MSQETKIVLASSAEHAEAQNFDLQMQAWKRHIANLAAEHGNRFLEGLVRIPNTKEETSDGVIEPIETPEGLEGEAAIVTMPSGMKSDTPHLHHNEHEGHLAIVGSALMSKGGENVELTPGAMIVVEPEVAHFTIPSEDGYTEIAISFPGYKPENQVPLDISNPPADFDIQLYAEAQARAA